MEARMVTTALELAGYEIVENIGIVRGIVVRSRSIVGAIWFTRKEYKDFRRQQTNSALDE